ncbi:MAG: M23 family metallopeptidase [Cyclobacteriaceae bacterium]
MAQKKTLSNWLTNRYLLIIRNEENFAEKKTIRFNYARLILILFAGFLVALSFSIYLVTFTLEEWLDPRFAQMQTNRQLLELTMKIDSMEQDIELKDQYFNNLQRILSGDVDAIGLIEEQSDTRIGSSEIFVEDLIQPIDSQLRAEFENTGQEIFTYQASGFDEIRDLYLFTPIEGGIITDHFNPKADHFGVDIVAKENEPVKSISEGMVIFSSWTMDSGYVIGIQHKGNLISVYKHNSELLKNVGNFVSGGEVIAIIGNTGELTSGPHLHVELWHNGNAVNPMEYIAF